MEFGIATFISAETANPGEYAMDPVELGQELEQRGFESLFAAEHTHIPVNGTEYPGPESDTYPNYFYSMLDPFVVLTAVAAATERLKIASGVALVPQRDPIQMAKEVATLDLLSQGRLILGVGAGWNLEEARNHGVEPRRRFRVLREHVEAMKTIWTEDIAEYKGDFVRFSPLYSWPKPLQAPHPPIYLGGWAPAALQRVLDIADGWLSPNIRDAAEIAAMYRRLCDMAREQERPKPRLTVLLRTATQSEIARAAEVEPERMLFWTEPLSRDAMLRRLDEWGDLMNGARR